MESVYLEDYFLLPFESPIFMSGGGGTYSGLASVFLDITLLLSDLEQVAVVEHIRV
ncbi:hypothetical protein ACINWC743_A0228 [Acinetobacter sp. WC-743]|uniref:hypothetical protein n=1 Tax=Acinetobacter sp. WC-743 TaxID=903945 RepID=UPI0002AED2D9|nr:hypothetical protein [Acinetobacter sp. WC-743]ELW78753.1 hypothetical protein ACINWC743_A0228 [Acinetobacter sp. WC-743]